MGVFNLKKRKDSSVEEYVLGPRHRGITEEEIEDEDVGNRDEDVGNRDEDVGNRDEEDMDNGNVENGDKLEDNNMESDIDDNDQDEAQDYIDPDDLNYEEYEDILDTIVGSGWHTISPETNSLTNLDENIVVTKTARSDVSSDIIEITCPKEMIIAMCGVDECGVDLEDFYNMPNLYSVPHFFSFKCTIDNGLDMYQDTLVSIWKVSKDGIWEKYYQMFYGDVSILDEYGRLKKREDRYYFPTTIVLQGEEKLVVKVHNSKKYIYDTSLLAMADIFEKDK